MKREATCDIPVVASDHRPIWLVTDFVVPGSTALISPFGPNPRHEKAVSYALVRSPRGRS